MSDCHSKSDTHTNRDWNLLLSVQLSAFAVLGCFYTASQRYLFADGSLFFLNLLRDRSVSSWSPARYYAHWLTQIPVAVLLRDFDCRDLGLAATTYGISLFFIPLAALALTAWAANRAPAHYFAYPMLSQSILYLTTSMVMFSEIHPATWLYWCLLYLLLFSERLTVTRGALLLVLGVLSTRTYESSLVLAWPPVYAACDRFRTALKGRSRGEAVIFGACLVLFLVGFGVALYSAIFPDDEENRENFRKSLFDHFDYLPVRFSLLVLAAAVLFTLRKNRPGYVVLWIAVAFGGYVAVSPIFGLHQEWYFQYLSRVQAIYVPFVLGVLVAVSRSISRGTGSECEGGKLGLWRLTALTCVVSVVFQGAATWRWLQYRNALLMDLSTPRGVIRYDESTDRPREFDWGWAMPPLCITLGAVNRDTVTTIISSENPDDSRIFDPGDFAKYSHLSSYGIMLDVGENAEEDGIDPDTDAPDRPGSQ